MLFMLSCLALLSQTAGQQIGSSPEHHPKLRTQYCSSGSGCSAKDTVIVLDAQWRELYDVRTGGSCITDAGKLNTSICPTIKACAEHCALDGIDYTGTGVDVAQDSKVTLKMYEKYQGELVEIGPQIYLLDPNVKQYQNLHLLNQEISFEVDVSELPCGMNGAIYLAGMDPSGGRSKLNPAGATYGTGYCDSQCYQSYNFINGVANLDKKGACCNEMDLLEANSRATQYTAHPCRGITGLYECHGKECGDGREGVCDSVGCGFNPYGLGDHDFYGIHAKVNTSKPFKVVTQFHTDDRTSEGRLLEIRRFYVQDGQTIQNSRFHSENRSYAALSPDFCRSIQAKSFHHHDGLTAIGEALKHGMVLIMGIWGGGYMTWLDSGDAGPCSKKEDQTGYIKKHSPNTRVTFSDIRWGDIGTTVQEK